MSIIDNYFKKITPAQKVAFATIDRIVRELAPEAEEVTSYGMPGYKYKGKYLLGFFAFKDHLSLFPTSGPVEALRDKLKDFATSKGTLQFSPDKPIPEHLLKEIITNRIAAISEHPSTKYTERE